MQAARYSPYKRNAFMAAVSEGRIDGVREIITTRGPRYAREWKDGYSLLNAAVENKHTEVAKLLLTSGSKVNHAYKNHCNTPLHFAALNGDVEFVQMLLDRGANIDARNTHGKTPLHNAVVGIKTEIVDMLLNLGADIDAADKSGMTPLHLAVKSSRIKSTKLLLSRGANIQGKGNYARTSRRTAANRGYSQIVWHLLKYRAYVNSARASMFRNVSTPLHLAVRKGHEKITELLLSNGANVNARENDGATPLHIATRGRHLTIVEHLLEYGADFNSTTQNGRTPLYLAVQNRREKIVKLLLECGACVDAKDENDKSILHLAVEVGLLIIVRHILKHRPDLNDKSNSSVLHLAVQGWGKGERRIFKNLLLYGFTVNPNDANKFMRAAVEEGCVELVEELLKHGTDVNMLSDSTSGKDSIPLHVATKHGHEEVAKLLISYGADVNALDETGRTPIFSATENANLKFTEQFLTNNELMEMLLNTGANVNAGDPNGKTALHYATEKGNTEVVELLLTRGAEVDAASNYMRTTPLHIAAEFGYLDIVELLLKFGAKVDSMRNRNALTHFQVAVRNNHVEIVKLLLKLGANVDSADDYGLTALHIASKRGHEEVVTALLEHGADVTIRSRNNYTALGFAMHRDVGFSAEDYDDFNVARILKRHMVKIIAADSYTVNDGVLSIPAYAIGSDEVELCDLQNKCEKEVASMKSEKVVNANITFYDILTKGVRQLAMYARNESIIEAFGSGDYKEKFPIYGSMISMNFRKGEKRKEFLEQGNKILDVHFNDFSELPRGCTERILSYFNDDDFKALIEAGKSYA